MRKIIQHLITFTLAMCMFYAMGTLAQQNWIKCQHLLTGAIQMHPGMSCPPQWAPV